MSLFSKALRAALTRLCAHLPRRDITGPDGSLYVSQYLLSPSAEKTAWRLRLHHFVRGDVDRELHSLREPSRENYALVQMVTAMPWLLRVAESGHDPAVARSELLKAATESKRGAL